MLLFDISASAQGRNILKGLRLTYDDMMLSLGVIEQYHKTIPVSINITSVNYDRYEDSRNYVDALFFNEFINGFRKPHTVYLNDHHITLPDGEKVYEDRLYNSRAYYQKEKQFTY